MEILKITSRNILLTILTVYATSCTKFVKIGEPTNTITATETFSTDDNATSAITGIYSNMSDGSNFLTFSNGALTPFVGSYADELTGVSYLTYNTYNNSKLLPADYFVNAFFWTPAYYDIYSANAVIEGLKNSTTISHATKDQLTGEAKFIRAFCHFYLVNLFGDVPLDTTTSYTTNSLLSRTPSASVYNQIIADLVSAQQILASDYSLFHSQRIRATKWAATALLARVYLYTGNWASADSAATAVINCGLYSLEPSLDTVFLANSAESILQLQPSVAIYPYATQEANLFVPYDTTSYASFNLTPQLLAAFEPNDQRRVHWVDSTDYGGAYYQFPNKYKVRVGNQAAVTEYYTLLRLAEQYLIRAEADANGAGSGPVGAIQDLNTIRSRAMLPPLTISPVKGQVLAAVQQERRIELFAEMGHRWFDLKRTGSADSVMAAVKPTYWTSSDQLLWPLPSTEIALDPNLKQNPGY